MALLAAAQETAPPKCAVSGTVVDSATGQPLSKVSIQIEGLGDDIAVAPFTTTDAKGSFTVVDLPPGQYRLKGRRNGYLETYYGARRAEGSGTPITLEAGQNLSGLTFKLMPFGVIAGTVRDQDGEPLAGATITVHRLVYEDGRRRMTKGNDSDLVTDDLGQYRVTGLVPGRYYVRADPADRTALSARIQSAKSDRPQEALLPALYPGVPDPAAARPVEVGVGARVTGIDITLPRSATQRVTGHATVGAGATLNTIALEYAGAGRGDAGYEYQARRKENGDFEFPAVPPGSYVLAASAQLPHKPSADIVEMIMSQMGYTARVPVVVGSTPVDNVQVVLGAPAQIDGRIVVEGGNDAKLAESRLTFDNGVDTPIDVTAHEDLHFSTGLGPGRYDIDLWPGGDYVLRRVRLEGKDITDEGLTISGPGKIVVEILVGKDAGDIEGAVSDKDKPVPGAVVVLIPEPRLRIHRSLFQESETDQSGRFQIKGVAPGTYKLFAWDDIEPGAWWDPDFLKNYEGKGETVTLKPGGHESAALKLIAVEDQ